MTKERRVAGWMRATRRRGERMGGWMAAARRREEEGTTGMGGEEDGISRVLGFIPLDCRHHRHRWMLRVAGPRAWGVSSARDLLPEGVNLLAICPNACSPEWSRTIGNPHAPPSLSPRFFPPLPIALSSALFPRTFSPPRFDDGLLWNGAVSEKLEGPSLLDAGRENPHVRAWHVTRFSWRRLSCWPGTSRATMYVKNRSRREVRSRARTLRFSLLSMCTRPRIREGRATLVVVSIKKRETRLWDARH